MLQLEPGGSKRVGAKSRQERGRSRARAGQEQGRSILSLFFAHISSHAIFHEQGRSRAGSGQEQVRNRAGAGQEQSESRSGARPEQEPNHSPNTKFHPCLVYNMKLKDFTIGRFWLVGLVGKENSRCYFKLIPCYL